MSVRVYQLSKELEMPNKEVLALLQERGLDVKSASNTIPNIYADSILEEFSKGPIGTNTAPEEEKKPKAKVEKAEKEAEKEAEDRPKLIKKADAPKIPEGPIVKSAQEIQDEREAELKKKRAKVIPPQPKIVSPPPAPAGKLAPKVPPAPAGMPSRVPPRVPPRAPTIVRQSTSPTPPAMPKPSVTLPEAPKAPPAVINAAKAAPPIPGNTTPPPMPMKAAPEKAAEIPEAERKTLKCKAPIIVREFAILMGMKPFKLISELMEIGVFASMNQAIDDSTALKLGAKHGFNLEIQHRGAQQVTKKKKEEPKADDPKLLEPRPPVVCVLGHVDHGKTTLLDTIRKANVVSGEAGGITQHIGAYQVIHNKHKVTFIDTPGHAAFSKMRERGANVTDIAILVVAADDGFKPQTIEAMNFAQRANVPIVVAINKMDAKGANIDRVKQQLQEKDLTPEDWGGETLCTPVSALKAENIDKLIEQVLLQAEIMELKANPKCASEGIIIESQVETGRGSTATIIVQKGTLKIGDAIVCGAEYCKVRAMMDDKGNRLKSAPPSTPVSLLGWSGAPEAGGEFKVVKNEREAKKLADERAHENKMAAAEASKEELPQDIDKLFAAIADTKQKTLNVIIKGDVHGTVEALQACLEGIESEKVNLNVIYADVGLISKSDVQNASGSEAVVVAFNTKLENGVQAIAKHNHTRIIQHNIIYELIDQVKDAMAELLEPELREHKMGAAEVRQVFSISKGSIAGCMVTEGLVSRDKLARVIRGKKELHSGKIVMLKRFKDDTNEVRAGYECGVQIGGFNSFESGDIIECFEITKVRPSL